MPFLVIKRNSVSNNHLLKQHPERRTRLLRWGRGLTSRKTGLSSQVGVVAYILHRFTICMYVCSLYWCLPAVRICPVIALFEHRVMSFVMFPMISITGPIAARHGIGSFCSSLRSCAYFQRPSRYTGSWNPCLKQRPDILLSLHKQAGYQNFPDSEMSWMIKI